MTKYKFNNAFLQQSFDIIKKIEYSMIEKSFLDGVGKRAFSLNVDTFNAIEDLILSSDKMIKDKNIISYFAILKVAIEIIFKQAIIMEDNNRFNCINEGDKEVKIWNLLKGFNDLAKKYDVPLIKKNNWINDFTHFNKGNIIDIHSYYKKYGSYSVGMGIDSESFIISHAAKFLSIVKTFLFIVLENSYYYFTTDSYLEYLTQNNERIEVLQYEVMPWVLDFIEENFKDKFNHLFTEKKFKKHKEKVYIFSKGISD